MNMEKNFIEIDAAPWLHAEGTISNAVYFGRECEAAYTKSMTLEELIDQELESFISPKTNKIAEYHADDTKKLIESLKRAVKYAKKRVEELS